MDNISIKKAVLGNNLLWRCVFTDELITTPFYDLVYTFGVDARFMSSAQRIDLPVDQVEKELEIIESFYRHRNKTTSLYLDPATGPEGLEKIIRDRGYVEFKPEEEIWWKRDLGEEKLSDFKTQGLRIVTCELREEFEDHLKAAMEGYKDFKFWGSLLSKSYKDSNDAVLVKHYVAYLGDRPVACSTLGIYFDIVYLINTAVVPDFRRQGVHTSMMLHRLWEAKRLGATTAYYQTDFDNEASIATGKKVGFTEAFRRRLFSQN